MAKLAADPIEHRLPQIGVERPGAASLEATDPLKRLE
jgi:hypothetical protein